MIDRAVFLVAGGTGGHLFPAQALSSALAAHGYEIELVTDERGLAFGDSFPARAIHVLPSATPTIGGLVLKALAMGALFFGLIAALFLFIRRRPLCVVGFGGYPTVPPLIAAWLLRIPCFIHEQNAVMGRANAFLARFVEGIATGFPEVGRLAPRWHSKMFFSGNPVRPTVLTAAQMSYDAHFMPFRILVTGGSQGARIMSETVPAAISLLDLEMRTHLFVVQQARGEDELLVRAAYERAHVSALVAPFFADLPIEMARAHLVIARSGASTVSELAVIGRPSVLVPFPHALDQDQAMNARYLSDHNAAVVIAQKDFTPEWLASYLQTVISKPDDLVKASHSAKLAGRPHAADDLAHYIIRFLQRSLEAETKT